MFVARAKPTTATLQRFQERSIIAWATCSVPGQDELTGGSDCVGPFDPLSASSATSALRVEAGLRRRKACTVGSDHPFRLKTNFLQQLILHFGEIEFAQLLVCPLQCGVVGETRQPQHGTDLVGCQQPLFHLPIAELQVEHQQHTGSQLRQLEVVGTFGMRILRQYLARKAISDSRNCYVVALSLLVHTLTLAQLADDCNRASYYENSEAS